MFCESGNGLIMTDGSTCHAVGGGATCMPEKMGLQHLEGPATTGALDCLSDNDNRGCTDKSCMGVDPKTHKPFLDEGCIVAPNVMAPAFHADLFLINLGQNDYGKPAHIDPKTHKQIPSHLPTTEQWTRYYTEFVTNLSTSDAFRRSSSSSSNTIAPVPQFFLAVGGMADKYLLSIQYAVHRP